MGSAAPGVSPGKTESSSGISWTSSSDVEPLEHFSEADQNLAGSAGHSELLARKAGRESDNRSVSAGQTPEPQTESGGSTVLDKSQSEQAVRNIDQSVLASGNSFGAEEARMLQEKIIRQKKRQKVRPAQGRWLTQKLTQRQMNLEDLQLTTKWRCQKEVRITTPSCHLS